MNYNKCALILILVFVVLMFFRMDMQPFSLDIYYHLAVALGFSQAGGITAYDFWEFAPVGRPHLYPPLLHILMLAFYKAGFSLINIGKIFCMFMFPAIAALIYWINKKLFNTRIGFSAVLTAVVPYSFFVGLSNNVSASLAIMLLLLAFYAVEKEKIIASGILIGLALCSNIMISFWFIAAFVLYGILRREKLKIILLSLAIGLALALFWIAHILNNISVFTLGKNIQTDFIEINPILYLFVIWGIIVCLKEKKQYLFYLTLLLVTPIFAFMYPYRFISSQGMLPVILIAGFGLEKFFAGFNSAKRILIMLVILVLFMFNPMIAIGDKGSLHLNYQDSTFTRLTLYNKENFDRHNDLPIYGKWVADLGGIVKDNTKSDDIIYTNLNYVGGVMSVIAERATSSAMLFEVAPQVFTDPVLSANVIIWIKNIDDKMDKQLVELINKFKLEKITETGIAYIYRNPQSTFKAQISPAVLPTWLAFTMVLIYFGLVVWDLKFSVD